MNKQDFLKLSGAAIERAEYLPVAFMIRGGYGCAGYYNAGLNDGLTDTCVLLNMRLVEFPPSPTGQSSIHNFSEFLERIVARHYREVRRQDEAGDPGTRSTQTTRFRWEPWSIATFSCSTPWPTSRP